MYKLLFLMLPFVTLTSSCSTFSNQKNIINMFQLPKKMKQSSPSIVWSVSIGYGTNNFYSNLCPVYAYGIVYAADRKGTVKAINVRNGEEIWLVNLGKKNRQFSHDTSALLSGGISISGNYIYIGSEKAIMYALNTIDGSIIWKTHAVGEILSHPVISNNTVLIHTSNGQLQAFNKNNGMIKWTMDLGDTSILSLRGESTPTVAFDAIIVGNNNGLVSAILIQNENRQVIWQQRISQIMGPTETDYLVDVDTTPIVIDGVVYTLSYHGNIAALDLWSGEIIWKRELSSVKDFVVNGQYIYLVDENDRLLALNAKNGTSVWMQRGLLHRNLTAPTLQDSNIVVGDSEGYIHWIDSENGNFVAQKKIDNSGFLNKPIIAGDKLLIQAKNGMLYAVLYKKNNQ